MEFKRSTAVIRLVLLALLLTVPLTPQGSFVWSDSWWKDFAVFNIRYLEFMERLYACPPYELNPGMEYCEPTEGVFDEALWMAVDGAARKLWALPTKQKQEEQ